jgi:hypothetical protein
MGRRQAQPESVALAEFIAASQPVHAVKSRRLNCRERVTLYHRGIDCPEESEKQILGQTQEKNPLRATLLSWVFMEAKCTPQYRRVLLIPARHRQQESGLTHTLSVVWVEKGAAADYGWRAAHEHADKP